ncbi:cystathionine gamma-lyase [Klebsiella quasipneumoniae]|nr:cystathionine gamma-lyase [Klebsiella quasipneumoniae]
MKLAHKAASLGSVGTLVGPPCTTSHVELTAEERANAGIPEGLIRYSAGIENLEDLIEDLRQALDRGLVSGKNMPKGNFLSIGKKTRPMDGPGTGLTSTQPEV